MHIDYNSRYNSLYLINWKLNSEYGSTRTNTYHTTAVYPLLDNPIFVLLFLYFT